jgi:ABC-type iron transport system FetAB permease component
MWTYYKANKPMLISSVRLHRASILSELMLGATPQVAFAPYMRPADNDISFSLVA